MDDKDIVNIAMRVNDMAISLRDTRRQRDQLRESCQMFVDSLEGKPIEPEEAIGAIRTALKQTENTNGRH